MHPISTANQVGQIIIARRKVRELSQQQLATALNLSQNRLSELEQQPGKLTLDRLLDVLNVLGLELSISERKLGSKSTKVEW